MFEKIVFSFFLFNNINLPIEMVLTNTDGHINKKIRIKIGEDKPKVSFVLI